MLPAILIYTPVGVMYQSPSSLTSACPAGDKHGISSPNSALYKEGKNLLQIWSYLLYICFPITFYSRHELKVVLAPISTQVTGIPCWHILHPSDMWTCKIDALCVLSATDCPNWMISVLPSSVWLHWSLSNK